jgi:hypothetical protein
LHPKVKQFYNQTGIEILESVQDQLERTFAKQTAKSTVEVTINQIYRVKFGGVRNKEHVWYNELHSSTDRKGNVKNLVKAVGKYEMPVAQYNFDDEGNPQPAGVSDFKTVYELEWSPKLIDEFEDKRS